MRPFPMMVRKSVCALSMIVALAAVGGCSSPQELGQPQAVEQMASVLEDIGRCDPTAVKAAVTMLRLWALRLPTPHLRLVFAFLGEALRVYCSSRRGEEERRDLAHDLERLEQMLDKMAASNASQEEQIRHLKRQLRAKSSHRTCGEFRYQNRGTCKDKRHEGAQ